MKKIILSFIILTGLSCLGKSAASADDKSMKLFQAKCASCHAKDGSGNASMAKVFKLDPSALSLVSKTVADQKDEEISAVTTNGKGKMPAYKGKLTKEEIDGLTAYIRSLAPKK